MGLGLCMISEEVAVHQGILLDSRIDRVCINFLNRELQNEEKAKSNIHKIK